MLDRMSLLFRFQTIAETGSVRRAAEELNIAQPALSRSLQQLEKHYGQDLFERHSRGVRLTPFGQKLLTTIGRLARDWELAEAEISGNVSAAAGHLRIQAGPFWFAVVLPWALPRLQASFPNLIVEVSLSTGGASRNMLEGRVDVSFGGIYTNETSHTQLITRSFRPIRDRVVARADHPIQHCAPDDFSTVLRYPWAVYTADPIYEAETIHAVTERTGSMPQIRLRNASLLSIMLTLQQSDFLCILPDAAVEGLGGRNVRCARLELGRRSSDTGAVYRESLGHYAPMIRLLDLCDQFFRLPGDQQPAPLF